MKTILMTLALVTLASSFASAKTFCSVTTEGQVKDNYDKILFKGEVELVSQESKLLYIHEGSQVYATRTKDGAVSLTLMKPNSFEWAQIAFGNGKFTVLMNHDPKIAVACVEADVMPAN